MHRTNGVRNKGRSAFLFAVFPSLPSCLVARSTIESKGVLPNAIYLPCQAAECVRIKDTDTDRGASEDIKGGRRLMDFRFGEGKYVTEIIHRQRVPCVPFPGVVEGCSDPKWRLCLS